MGQAGTTDGQMRGVRMIDRSKQRHGRQVDPVTRAFRRKLGEPLALCDSLNCQLERGRWPCKQAWEPFGIEPRDPASAIPGELH